MWILYAFGSAFFAGITAILAKIGIKNTDSNLATAIRTIVILAFSWLMVFVVGSIDTINELSQKTIIFLILSGLATGLSWLCYFRALQLGNVNKVTPIDKSSTILTMVLAIIFLGEKITILKIISIILIGVGTYLMIEKKDDAKQAKDNKWLILALGSALFASLTSILGKVGIEGVESNLGTAIRTVVVLIMAWILVFMTGKQGEIKNIDKKSWKFLIFSGLTTGLSWLCYYKALQDGQASIVVPIDKLSIIVTMAFSYFILKEKFSKKSIIGLTGIVLGTLILII
jgi:transporter family protein